MGAATGATSAVQRADAVETLVLYSGKNAHHLWCAFFLWQYLVLPGLTMLILKATMKDGSLVSNPVLRAPFVGSQYLAAVETPT